MSDARKGKDWLRDKLSEMDNEIWREIDSVRFSFKNFGARLVDATPKTHAQEVLAEMADTRQSITASFAIDVLSVRVRGRDMRRKGRLVETWIRCEMLKRLVTLSKPTRVASRIGCSRYGVAMSYLSHHGVACEDGRGGYQWTERYQHLRDRAAWLVEVANREGELRRLGGSRRYSITDD